MSKSNDAFEMKGKVVEIQRGDRFLVQLNDIGTKVLCTISGKLRMNKIRVMVGDNVTIDVNGSDPSKGRITWRDK